MPFGEFIPFENLLAKWGLKKITFGYSSFSSGSERKEIRVFNNLSFLPLLCYEIIYSGDLKRDSKDYNFIINISEDGWFGDSIGPHQHLTQAVFRAVEQGVPIVRSTNKGKQLIIPIETGLHFSYDLLTYLKLKTGFGWRFLAPNNSRELSGYYVKFGLSFNLKKFNKTRSDNKTTTR